MLYCNDLTEEEKKQMELFIRMRREKVLGRGEVKLREPGDQSPQWVSIGTVELFYNSFSGKRLIFLAIMVKYIVCAQNNPSIKATFLYWPKSKVLILLYVLNCLVHM